MRLQIREFSATCAEFSSLISQAWFFFLLIRLGEHFPISSFYSPSATILNENKLSQVETGLIFFFFNQWDTMIQTIYLITFLEPEKLQ